MHFSVLQKDTHTNARVGKMVTPHGVVETPSFVPVGTQATVKGLSPQDLQETGTQILFGNTYHLHLRPGENVVKDFGGLGKFMGWSGVTITDSGGFQVFSLGRGKTQNPSTSSGQKYIKILQENLEFPLVKVTDSGVEFRSHIDGSKHFFTPEESIQIQKKLGADLIVCFDECAPHPSTHKYTKEAMGRTHKWAVRSLAEFNRGRHSGDERREDSRIRERSWTGQDDGGLKQALYGIIQGGVYKDLREESARFISSLPFDGIAIGGVSVGESKEEMRNVLSWVQPYLPEDKPRHLLGIGEIDDIFDAVAYGMDTFDCVIPTRFGRYGIVFASPPEGTAANKFRVDLSKSQWANDKGSVTKNCECKVCSTYTRGYVSHLFRADELLAYRLASYHNVYFLNNLIKQIREAIGNGQFGKLKGKWIG